MTTQNRIKWTILASLAVIAIIAAFVLPVVAQATLPREANHQRAAINTAYPPYPDYDLCAPYPGPYPLSTSYPPYPGACIFLPALFSNFNLGSLWDAVAGQ